MKTTSAAAVLLAATALVAPSPWAVFCVAETTAETAAESSPEKAAAESGASAYEAAYAKGEAAALAEFFAEDAEYVSGEGRSWNGRSEIEAGLRATLASAKGSKLAIQVDSVRPLGPEVFIEKGSTSVTSKSGEVSGALYTAILQKREGKWKIAQLLESPIPGLTSGERLAELGWLVGKWEETDKASGISVESEFAWARGGNFLTRNVAVKRGGETELEGWQIIGWDPSEESIRSWTFDAEGGFSEGSWTREGNRWLLREIGVSPDGARTSADNTITRLGDDKFAWESDNRTLDGNPQPSIGRIEISRAKGN